MKDTLICFRGAQCQPRISGKYAPFLHLKKQPKMPVLRKLVYKSTITLIIKPTQCLTYTSDVNTEKQLKQVGSPEKEGKIGRTGY